MVTEADVMILTIDPARRRIGLARTPAIVGEEQAEARAYLHDTDARAGGFGMTLGEMFRQARRK